MKTYQPFSDFSAQSKTVSALMSMYAQLESGPNKRMDLTPIVVFLAFSIESYLNSIGARKLDIWDELERLPWKKKMTILHKVARKFPDWSKDPLQFATEVFSLRDKLAHGKPERVLGPIFTDQAQAMQYQKSQDLQPEWYAKITKEWVIEAKERFRILMIYLGQLFSFHESDHLLNSTGGFLIDDGKQTTSGL